MKTNRPGDKNKGTMDIRPTEKVSLECHICGKVHETKAALAGHIGAKHKIKMEDYVVQFYFDGKRPKCAICESDTRFVKGEHSFKKYCPEHADEARKSWSKTNPLFNPAWKKGLTKDTHKSILKQSIVMTGKNNMNSYTKEKYDETTEKICVSKGWNILTPYSEYHNNAQKLKCKCNKCNKITRLSMSYLNHTEKNPVCRHCIPQGSREEKEVVDFVRSFYPGVVLENDRKLIAPKEVDMFIPEKKIAIEYHGLFWHKNKGKKYHQQKHIDCLKSGVTLISVFSDEWKNKRDIIHSIIMNKMQCTPNKIAARKCKIKEIPWAEAKAFYEEHHIAGSGRPVKSGSFGLISPDGKLVAIATIGKPMAGKYADSYELFRFCTAKMTNVVGGFSKLLKHIQTHLKERNINRLVTYADLRFGQGNVYIKNGFVFQHQTRPDYWYSDGKERFHRFKFRATKEHSEKRVAEINNVFPIYGCGSNVFLLTF